MTSAGMQSFPGALLEGSLSIALLNFSRVGMLSSLAICGRPKVDFSGAALLWVGPMALLISLIHPPDVAHV